MRKKILIYLLVLTVGIWFFQAVGESLIIRLAIAANALLDGVIHSDTTNSAVTRGDLIYGNSTPAWDDLAIGTNGQLLQSGASDISWVTFAGSTDITTLGTIAIGTWQGTTVAVNQGGTGATSLTDGGVLLGSDTTAITAMSVLGDGAIIVGDGTTDPVALTAFTNSTGDVIHEAGGLEADVNAYDGLVGITGGATFNQTGTTTQIVIFDGSGAPTSAALSSDVTMDNAGAVTIANNAVALTTDTTGNYVTSVATTSPLAGGSTSEGATLTLSIPLATGAVDGYLSSTDWATFNGKLGAETDTLYSVVARGSVAGADISASDVTVDNLIATSGTASAVVVDTQFLEYSTGGAVTVRDDLQINGNVLYDGTRRATGYHTAQGSFDLASMYDIDTEWRLMDLISNVYPSGIVITSWSLDCSVDDPTTEVTGEIKYCDALSGGAFPGDNAVGIFKLNTTTGNSASADVVQAIAADKLVYFTLATDPADANTVWMLNINFYIP